MLLGALVTIPFVSVVYYYKGMRLHRMIVTWFQRPSKFDGRIVVISGLLMYFGVLAALSLSFGVQKAWMRLGVPALLPSFWDLWNMLAGIDCYAHGVNIFQTNFCSLHAPAPLVWGPWDQPRVWLLLSALGVSEKLTVPLGITLALSFLALLLWRLGRFTVRQGLLVVALVCSPAVMLGIERGNFDLLMFDILAIAIYLIEWQRIRVRMGGYACIMVAAILKLFPAFAFLTLAKEGKHRWLLVSITAAILAVYGMATFHDIITMMTVAPRDVHYSYGASVLVEGVNLSLSATKTNPFPVQLAVLIAGLVLFSGVFLARHSKENEFSDERHANAFLAGAAIFLGSFIILGNNFDYRLIFLLFTIPQLLTWTERLGGIGRLSLMAIVAIALRLWFVSLFSAVWISDILSWWLVWFYGYSVTLLLRSHH